MSENAIQSCGVCLSPGPHEPEYGGSCHFCATGTLDPADNPPAAPALDKWECGARKQGTAGGNDPVDCNWPYCGCDPKANDVLHALDEDDSGPGEIESLRAQLAERDATIDDYDRRMTLARNALRDAGVPDTDGVAPNHRALDVHARITILAAKLAAAEARIAAYELSTEVDPEAQATVDRLLRDARNKVKP